MLTPTGSRLTRLGNCHIKVRALDGLRTNLILVSVALLREDGVARTSSLDGGILVEERAGIKGVVKESLLDVLLIFELFAFLDRFAVLLAFFGAGVAGEAARGVFLAEGGVGGFSSGSESQAG